MEQHLPGVYVARKKDNSIYYRASLTWKQKHISLGSYSDARQAHQAYLEACNLLHETTIHIMDFEKMQPKLSFDKWVCLINLRDNGIYLHNPIYIRPKMFYYYYSPIEVYKFDVEDLFFYSSHKLMKRGSHLFVSEYGMQTNIASRYGIKNNAVCGKDYEFINGDPTDYRYSNIRIKNQYHGVSYVSYRGKMQYRCRIHLRGYFIVGYYDSAETAAIAYNKAIDLLKAKGCKKSYTINRLDGIGPAEYADRYHQIKISGKIMKLDPADYFKE